MAVSNLAIYLGFFNRIFRSVSPETEELDSHTSEVYIYAYTFPCGDAAMIETRIAKLFKNGASQAVRLPMEFRFEGEEVFVTRDAATGDVVLSTRPGAQAWGEFFELLRAVDVPADFLAERPLNTVPHERGLFDDERVPSAAGR